MSYQIRPMAAADLDVVHAIENTSHIAPWSKKIIHDCLKVGYACFVLVKRKKVRGYAISRVSTGVCHLLNLCIDHHHQGKGFGEALLQHVLQHVHTRCIKVTLEVRPSNAVARKLYQKYQFEESAVKKNYYNDPDGTQEDGLVLTKYLVD